MPQRQGSSQLPLPTACNIPLHLLPPTSPHPTLHPGTSCPLPHPIPTLHPGTCLPPTTPHPAAAPTARSGGSWRRGASCSMSAPNCSS